MTEQAILGDGTRTEDGQLIKKLDFRAIVEAKMEQMSTTERLEQE